MLKTVEFIINNSNWEQLIQSDPYCIRIKRKDNLIMFNYTQGISQPCEIVNECRGLILDESDNFKVIRYGLYRFYNYGEPGAATIDSNSMQVIEKVDGSLIMFYYYNNIWHSSTRNSFDSYDAEIGDTKITFAELIDRAIAYQNIDVESFDKNLTYVFEIVSPESRLIVDYHDKTRMYFLMARDRNTLEEVVPDEYYTFLKPETYDIKTVEDAVEFVSKFDGKDFEGVVVKDAYNNRLKVKNVNYLKMHKMYANGRLNYESALEMILNGEDSEYLSYFPESKHVFDFVRDKRDKMISCAKELDNLHLSECWTRKQFAETLKEFSAAQKYIKQLVPLYANNKALAFKAYDEKAEEWVRSLSANRFVKMFMNDGLEIEIDE